MTSVELFRAVFHGLDEETLQNLQEVVYANEYPANTVLCRQGHIEDTFYVIVEGEVAASQILDDGHRRVLGICGPNQFFGEMSLLDQTPRIATITTLTKTKVLEITQDVFRKIVDQSPAVAYAIMYRLLEHLRTNDNLTIKELLAKNKQLTEAYQDLQAAQLEIIKKERLERELEIAAEVQHSLLPQQLPHYPPYQFSAYLQYARYAGGDFYDVVELDEEHLGIVLGDIADRGVHASLFMAVTRTLFVAEGKRSLSPLIVTQQVHEGMLAVSANNDMFVTVFYGVLHRPSGRLTYTVAGQHSPLLLRQGEVEKLAGQGNFLGMMRHIHLEEHTVDLLPGDRLFCYSNGVVDAAHRMTGQPYGREHLHNMLKQGQHTPLPELTQHLGQDLVAWCGDMGLTDDIAFLVLEITP
jgi:serine phosphatase RsbU (regulator of sigma subunit)